MGELTINFNDGSEGQCDAQLREHIKFGQVLQTAKHCFEREESFPTNAIWVQWGHKATIRVDLNMVMFRTSYSSQEHRAHETDLALIDLIDAYSARNISEEFEEFSPGSYQFFDVQQGAYKQSIVQLEVPHSRSNVASTPYLVAIYGPHGVRHGASGGLAILPDGSFGTTIAIKVDEADPAVVIAIDNVDDIYEYADFSRTPETLIMANLSCSATLYELTNAGLDLASAKALCR